jgi:hypothetical protein
VAGAAAPFDTEFNRPLGHELRHLEQHVDVGSLIGKFGQWMSATSRIMAGISE